MDENEIERMATLTCVWERDKGLMDDDLYNEWCTLQEKAIRYEEDARNDAYDGYDPSEPWND